jgi:hypothetical protein
MEALETRKHPLPAEHVYSGLLKELLHAGFLITSCDRKSGFIAVVQPATFLRVQRVASILVEDSTDSTSTIRVAGGVHTPDGLRQIDVSAFIREIFAIADALC